MGRGHGLVNASWGGRCLGLPGRTQPGTQQRACSSAAVHSGPSPCLQPAARDWQRRRRRRHAPSVAPGASGEKSAASSASTLSSWWLSARSARCSSRACSCGDGRIYDRFFRGTMHDSGVCTALVAVAHQLLLFGGSRSRHDGMCPAGNSPGFPAAGWPAGQPAPHLQQPRALVQRRRPLHRPLGQRRAGHRV